MVKHPDYVDLHWKAALTLIKMRILCKFNLCNLQMKSAKEAMNKWCDDNIYGIIYEYFVGHDIKFAEKLVKETEKCVERYLDQMLKDNEVFVKALVNPGPLKNQPCPQFSSRGSNQEAFLVINKCCRLFMRVNGILKLIEKKVGSNPTYDPTMTDSMYW